MRSVAQVFALIVGGVLALFALWAVLFNWWVFIRSRFFTLERKKSPVPFVGPICALIATMALGLIFPKNPPYLPLLSLLCVAVFDPGSLFFVIRAILAGTFRTRPNGKQPPSPGQ